MDHDFPGSMCTARGILEASEEERGLVSQTAVVRSVHYSLACSRLSVVGDGEKGRAREKNEDY